MSVLTPNTSGIYKPEEDSENRQPANFAETIHAICDAATRGRRKKERYGSYSSRGAQSSPAARRLTQRITGERDD